MSSGPRLEPCPSCGKMIPLTAARCRYCGADLLEEDEGDEDRPARRQEVVGPTDFIVPTNVSAWSLLSCYLGLAGLCLPVVGLLFCSLALLFGIIALVRKRKQVTYGSVTSDIRAVLGVIFGIIGTLLWGGVTLYILIDMRNW